MKKNIIAICLLLITSHTMAQFTHQYQTTNPAADDDTYGFNRQSLFAGGTIGLGASNLSFNIGATPEIGFTIKQWLDVGGLININYYSESADPTYTYNYDTRTHSFNYGIGGFARAYPLPFLFLQVEPQLNFLTTNYLDYSTTPNNSYTIQATAPSLLLGGGYSQRIAGRSNFYFAIMFDALDNKYSPYRDPYTNVILPVFQAGFDFNLHPKQ